MNIGEMSDEHKQNVDKHFSKAKEPEDRWIAVSEAVDYEWYILLIGGDLSNKEPYVRTGSTYFFKGGDFWYNNHKSTMVKVEENVLMCHPLPKAAPLPSAPIKK